MDDVAVTTFLSLAVPRATSSWVIVVAIVVAVPSGPCEVIIFTASPARAGSAPITPLGVMATVVEAAVVPAGFSVVAMLSLVMLPEWKREAGREAGAHLVWWCPIHNPISPNHSLGKLSGWLSQRGGHMCR